MQASAWTKGVAYVRCHRAPAATDIHEQRPAVAYGGLQGSLRVTDSLCMGSQQPA